MARFMMNLRDKYFDFIRFGTKRIELRLNDEKRRQIKIGDEIEFSNDAGEIVKTKVVQLLHSPSFQELIENCEITEVADKSITREELLADLEKFYTPEKQREHGVVGIVFELRN